MIFNPEKLISFALLLTIIISSCNKSYDQQPISCRIIGIWKLDTSIVFEVKGETIKPNVQFEFTENNKYTSIDFNSTFYKNSNVITSPGVSGIWETVEDDNIIKLFRKQTWNLSHPNDIDSLNFYFWEIINLDKDNLNVRVISVKGDTVATSNRYFRID